MSNNKEIRCINEGGSLCGADCHWENNDKGQDGNIFNLDDVTYV